MDLNFNRRLSIAPMLDCTDRHQRFFLRLISKNILLYSEMITANALLHGNTDFFLKHNKVEYPVALQLGGANPKELAQCAKMVENAGFQEINLNCGCPSDRVQNGNFGACLMKDKFLVRDCYKAMQENVSIPVSIKCRIGVDENDSWEFFKDFVETIAEAGCKVFIIHARKAWLKGLSPKENREIPPLNYDFVYRIKKESPHLNITINGGVKNLEQIKQHLQILDGVMVGREAYENPWFLKNAEKEIFNSKTLINTRKEWLELYIPYLEEEFSNGVPATILFRHLFGIFNGLPGARKFRQILSNEVSKTKNPKELLLKAMSFVKEE